MSTPTLTDIPAEAEARAAATGSLLRLATAGSVDDGKSTLVGRLLFDSKSVLRDQLAAVERVSLDRGLTSADLALLTDGLRAEREQGITIDVAYRYFATPQRSFILADCPGHVQYTRNTVTGCSTADVVVLLVDARNGVLEQTRRHLAVAALLRVPHVIVAVNKIDLVDFSAEVYATIEADIRAVAAELGVAEIHVLPTSALLGDNIVEASASTPFYEGPTLLGLLESLPTARDEGAFRLPVQLVIRPQGAAPTSELRDYRGYAGQITSGTVRVGDPVVVLPSGRRSHVAGIDLGERSLEEAVEGQSVTVRLADDVDVARGDTVAAAGGWGVDGLDLHATQVRRDLLDAEVATAGRQGEGEGLRVGDRHAVRSQAYRACPPACGSAFQCHEQADVGQAENPGGPHGQILSGIAVDQGVRDRHHGERGGRHQHAREHRPQHAHGAAVGVPGDMEEPCRRDIAISHCRVLGEPPVRAREAGGCSKDDGGQHEAENEWCRAYRSRGIGYRLVVLRVGDGLVQGAQGKGGHEQDQRVEKRDAGGGQGAQAPEHLDAGGGAGAEVDRHGVPS